MDKESLKTLFSDKLYRIPDYQRGYAWEELQWNHFIQDVDALVDEEVKNHYTGTVVIFQHKSKPVQNYGSTDKLKLVDVVDGQQRLTTCCIYLSIIMKALIGKGLTDYNANYPLYLYSGSTSKLTLNNDTKDIFFDLLAKGTVNSEPQTPHQKRLVTAYKHFKQHIDTQIAQRKDSSTEYLENLFDAIVLKLNFTLYTIEEECEIGMTFELMNSRGKGLSVLELLKNYLMYWISRNLKQEGARKDLTDAINKNWKEVYINLGKCDGIEDQCLRTAWTLHCSHTPKNWKGYEGFKDNEYIPLRGLSTFDIERIQSFINGFSDGLATISKHYAVITKPQEAQNTPSEAEFTWLSKIHNTGNIANFLPLLIAGRIGFHQGSIAENEYIDLLKSLECYAYRVFLFESKRSNAGISSLFRWGNEVFSKQQKVRDIINWVYALINRYSPEKAFSEWLSNPNDWYTYRRLLRYTLFEYELHLLSSEGKGSKPKLEWKDLTDSTIEHILPQIPDEKSLWMQRWSYEDFKKCLHDIGNLSLTVNNSNYHNFEFERKKGKPGEGFCYANSDIRQERKLASYPDWTAIELEKRRNDIISWIKERWGITESASVATLPEEINEDDNNDE